MENGYAIALIASGGLLVLYLLFRGFKKKKESSRTFTNTADEFEADEKRRLAEEQKEKESKMDEMKEELEKEAERLHAIENPDADKPFAKINTLKIDEIPPEQEWEEVKEDEDNENEKDEE